MATSGKTRKRKAKPVKRRKKTTAARKKNTGPGFFERVLRWIFGKLFGVIWWVGLRVGIVLFVTVGSTTFYYYSTLPDMEALLDGRERGSVTLQDRNGDVFAWRGEQYQVTRTETASQHLVNAVVATEDKRFYKHFGLDPQGIARAMVANFKAGRVVQGGSTITQQVAKLLFFNNTRSIERHIKQVPIVLAMELKYSKNDILSIYLNRAYLGAGAQGFEAASQRYFGKSARDVSPAESAMLAGLLKAPSRYAPTRDINLAQGRANVILGLMQAQNRLTQVEADIARATPAKLSPAAEARAGGYFADWAMAAGPSFLTQSTTEDVVIATTFDPRLQRAAEQALNKIFADKLKEGSKAQAAIVLMSPDGAVRAMVGGRRETNGQVAGQFNRATQALRQPGSAFKTLVYAAGIETGMQPNNTFFDAPITLQVAGSASWSPKNYNRRFKGEVTLTQAFRESINTVAVKVSERAGRDNVRRIAKAFGIESPIAPGPALALGVSEMTLLEMTGAYAGILNGGRRSKPYGLREIRLKEDNSILMDTDREAAIRVIDEKTAGYMVYMLSQVVEAGTGRRAKLDDRPSAGKTGTTQAARDAWFIGFTGDYVAGVWMGYDNNTPLSGVTGGGMPTEIWRETMRLAHEGIEPKPLPILLPPGLAIVPKQQSTPATPTDAVAENILESVLDGVFGLPANN